MNITKVYKKGDKAVNEDAYVINEDAYIFAVIDGATGLDGIPGYLASQVVQENLQEITQANSLYQSMEQANKQLGKKMVDYYKANINKLDINSIAEIPKKQRSSTGLAAIQIQQNGCAIDYFHVGDCMLFLRYGNGDVRAVTHDLIQYFDQLGIREMIRLREEIGNKMDLDAIRERVNPILLQNRNKLNSSQGYGIIDGSEEAFNYIESGRIPLNKVTEVLLLSDGLLLPTKWQESDVWIRTAEMAFTNGLDDLLSEVETREKQDPQCVTYPRLKQRDDKTGILIEL